MIEKCIIREVKEEVGLGILALELLGLSSNPKNELVKYQHGDMIQYFTCEFYSNNFYRGIKVDSYEMKIEQLLDYKNHKELLRNEQQVFESLSFFRKNEKV
jgi:ADP-ribose pyrophosphatase YjhB (NUDIX family)